MNYGKANPGVYKSVELESKVASASPHELVQMLFDALLLQLQRGVICIENEDQEQLHICIQKSVDILTELHASLSTEVDTELPYNLANLYEYMQRQLLRARISDPKQYILEVIALVEPIASAWKGIAPASKR
ncbi:MAG: flagellar export chaperone FliS [Agarilytica sp.]